jgi:hypothetical protein
MQDFTKLNANNSKPVIHEKKDRWLTKDRMWNFIFWFGIAGGMAFATFAKFDLMIPDLFLIALGVTLLGVPLIVTLANKTKFVKKDTFSNSAGKILSKKEMPTINFIWPTLLGIALTLAISDKYAARQVISSFFTFFSLISGFILYFIFKNCPISILFNYKFWNSKMSQNMQRTESLSNCYNDLAHSHMTSNVNHKRKH